MKALKGQVPVTHKNIQSRFMRAVGSELTGLGEESLNIRVIPADQLFFAEEVIQVGVRLGGRGGGR